MQPRARQVAVTALGVALAVFVGLPTLDWPFGRDQGLYEYIGRGLLLGELPYGDAFDQKPPGIYAVHAIAMLLFGQGERAIRIVELGGIAAAGMLAARLAAPRLAGAGALLASAFYFTTFDFWHTAQVELWAALALLACWVAARGPGSSRRTALAGALGGLAFLFKFPVVLPALVIALERAAGADDRTRAAGRLVGFGLGAAVVVGASLLPWLLAGQLDAWWDVLVRYNLHYASVKPLHEVPLGAFVGHYAPLWVVAAAALGVPYAVRRREGLWTVAVLGACLAAVVLQNKYYLYHYGLLILGLLPLLLGGLALRRATPAIGLAVAGGLAVVGVLLAPSWQWNDGWSYRDEVSASLRGAPPGDPYVAAYGFSDAENRAVAGWLSAHANPGDGLCVRGFETPIYTLSGLRCPSRFFADFPLSDKALGYRVTEWSAEHAAAIDADPPRWMVTFATHVADRRALQDQGYRQRAAIGRFVVSERTPAPAPPAPPAPTVLFVVLDTVRADHTSLCGYDRPTTPVLERLADMGAATTCSMVTPGSWTLPSHASFFTGRSVLEHGAHWASDSHLGWAAVPARPLGDDLPTLAEQLVSRGFQAVMVSSNPLVGDASGLGRGFTQVRTAPSSDGWYGAGQVLQLDLALDELDGTRPLFLFLNIADAHDPWHAIPEGVAWLSPRPAFRAAPEEPDSDWRRYWRGELSKDATQALFDGSRDLYDWGVHRADGVLGEDLALLHRRGWLPAGSRVIVTSDHGEMLGEHGALGHGMHVYEPMVRAPLVVLEVGSRTPPVDLPEDLPGVALNGLVLDGRLPEDPGTATVASFAASSWTRWSGGVQGTSNWLARYDGATKTVWRDGDVWTIDLAADPSEQTPQPTSADPGLETLVTAMLAESTSSAEIDPEMLEALRAVGYVE